MSSTPIADHALLSDRHSCALVDRGRLGRVAELPPLRQPVGVRPAARRRRRALAGPAGGPSGRSSRPLPRPDAGPGDDVHAPPTGDLVLTDLLALGPDNGGHRLGTDVPHLLVRRLACTAGAVEVDVDYRPAPGVRADRAAARRTSTAASPPAAAPSGWCSPLPVELELDGGPRHGRLHARRPGETVHLALHRSTLEQTPARRLVAGRARRAARRAPSAPGSRGPPCTRPTTDRGRTWCTTAAGCCRACPSSPAAPSSPPRRRRCPRASAANATGTTATPGCATPASPWRRCGWPPARTRRATSSPS